jgi:hypothetical protein
MAIPNESPGMEFYSKNEIEQIDVESRKDYYRMLLKQVLEQNPKGISVARISKLTGLNKKTIQSHLDFLVAVRDAYKWEYGPRSVVYYPNGRLAHPIIDEPVEIGGRFYTFRVMESDFGKLIHIQEKKDEGGNVLTTVGGIVIHKEGLSKFIEELKQIEDGI